MIKTGLLVAPDIEWLAKLREEVDSGDVKLFIVDENVDNVIKIFEEEKIDIVLMGFFDEATQEIARHIYEMSPNTLICCLGKDTDPNWFASGILKGLAG